VGEEGTAKLGRFCVAWVDDDETGLAIKIIADPKISANQMWVTFPVQGDGTYTVVTPDIPAAADAVAVLADAGLLDKDHDAEVEAEARKRYLAGRQERLDQIAEEKEAIEGELAAADVLVTPDSIAIER
jgi:hypothetical protein